MTTGKIDRSAVATQLNRMQHAQAPTTVVPTGKVEEVAQKGPENIYGERSKLLDVKTGEGKAVSTTASTHRLWGQAALEGSKPPLAALRLKNLTVPEAKKKLGELEKEQAQLETRIGGRAEELDDKWKHMRLTKRTEALKAYLAETPSLPSEKRVELQQCIESSEAAQGKLDSLMGQVKELKPQAGSKKPGTPEERKELARQLWAARHDHSEAVAKGTDTVDDSGLKIERLALTENLIDPTGGADSKYGSMMGLVGQYFEVSFMISTLNMLYFSPMTAMRKELDREAQESEKRKVIEDHWRQRDDLMKQMLKDIPLKAEALKRPHESVAKRDFGKMSVSEAAKVHASKPKAD